MDALLLRPVEVAQLLSLSRSQTYQLLASGRLPVVRIGRSVRVPCDALQRWIAEHTIEPNDGGPR